PVFNIVDISFKTAHIHSSYDKPSNQHVKTSLCTIYFSLSLRCVCHIFPLNQKKQVLNLSATSAVVSSAGFYDSIHHDYILHYQYFGPFDLMKTIQELLKFN